MLSKRQQRELEERLQDIVLRVRAGQFANNRQLSDFYERSPSFTPLVKRTVVERGLMTVEEWSSAFSKRHAKQPSWTCPQCHFRWSGRS